MTVRIVYKKHNGKSDRVKVMLCLSHRKERKYFQIQRNLFLSDYDKLRNCLKNNRSGNAKLNQKAIKLRDELQQLGNEMLTDDDYVSAKKVMDKFNIIQRPKLTDVETIFDKFIADSEVSKSRMKMYYTVKKKLLTFKKNVSIMQLNKDFASKFYNYLSSEGLSDNYINSTIFTIIRSVINYAEEKGFKVPDTKFNTPKGKKSKYGDNNFYLTRDERQLLINYIPKSTAKRKHDNENQTKSLQLAKDYYILMMYTGLTQSDIDSHNRNDIYSENGITYLSVRRKKMQYKSYDKNDIPLISLVMDIINKYTTPNLLPKISTQKLNDAIKILMKFVGISGKEKIAKKVNGKFIIKEKERYQVMTAKTARKTFRNVLLNLNYNNSAIASLMGNSLHVVENYHALTNKDKANMVLNSEFI